MTQAGDDVPPIFPRRQRHPVRAAGGFAATFARHPARPRRGLLPGRRVWATIFSAAALAGACALVLPLIASIDFGDKNGQKARTVAERVGAYRTSATPTVSPSPTKTPTPSPSPRTGSEHPAAAVGRPNVAATHRTRKKSSTGGVPGSANFSTVTGLLIKNVMTGLCVDIPDFGPGKVNGRVQEFYCDGSSNDNQRWDLVVNQKGAGPHGADLFTIRNAKDGYCLDLPGYGPAKTSANVTEWYCHPGSSDNQMWYLDKKSSGHFWIRNRSSGKQCLDVSGDAGSGGPNAGLTIFPCNPKDDHLWSFS